MKERKQISKSLKPGMTVEINPQSDRSRKLIVKGIISKILTKSNYHPHGLLVKLQSGETGRVKSNVSTSDSTKPTDANSVSASETHEIQLLKLVEQGENHWLEFKSDILWSANFTSEDIKNHRPQSKELHAYGKATSKIIIAKTVAGFLNTDGGMLIVGVKEDKINKVDEIIGIELEFNSLKDASQDGYRRMVVDLIKDYFPAGVFNHLNNYLQIKFEKTNGLTICGIKIEKSDKKVFLKLNKTEHFYIRTDASTRELIGEEIVDYCQQRFD